MPENKDRWVIARIQPTYEELKPSLLAEAGTDPLCIQPTYEELKPYPVFLLHDIPQYPAYL